MKVTVQHPHKVDYGGKQYKPGDALDVSLSVAAAMPWAFVETQNEVPDNHRKFVEDQADFQQYLSEQVSTLPTFEQWREGKVKKGGK